MGCLKATKRRARDAPDGLGAASCTNRLHPRPDLTVGQALLALSMTVAGLPPDKVSQARGMEIDLRSVLERRVSALLTGIPLPFRVAGGKVVPPCPVRLSRVELVGPLDSRRSVRTVRDQLDSPLNPRRPLEVRLVQEEEPTARLMAPPSEPAGAGSRDAPAVTGSAAEGL